MTRQPYVLAKDGTEVYRGTEAECWQWIHERHGYSVMHALRHEGFTLTPVEAWDERVRLRAEVHSILWVMDPGGRVEAC